MDAKRGFIYGLLSLLVGGLLLSPNVSKSEPFKLMTVEPAVVPPKHFVLGLQSFGFSTNNIFADSNPILDLAATPNLGLKAVLPLSNGLNLAIGGRYLKFTDSSALEKYVKTKQPLVEKFQVQYSGFTSFLGVSMPVGDCVGHLNFQHAEVSGSKVTSLVGALGIPMGDIWSTIIEAGYDVANKQPRASLGVVRQGPTFGLRLGATYVEINDPAYQYKGAVPVIDLLWNFGGTGE